MYIRKSIRSYKGRTYTNYVLVESLATPKGPRQRTVCSLGDLSPRPRADWLKLARKIEDAVVGQTDLLDPADAEVADIVRRVRQRRESKPNGVAEQTAAPVSGGELIKVDPSRVTTERHREAGPVHVGYQFWQRLELDRILRDCGLSETVRQLSCAMILNRLIAPCSEHAMPDWVRRTALGDILGVDFDGLAEDRLYQVLDKLYPLRAAIEAALVARERSLFNLDSTIYLYDLTSTYFEGLATRNRKAKRGHSRDHRADCKQVVVGLVVNRDGFPITHEIFEGNTQDRTTLATMLDRLAERIGLKEGATVVLDRGMAFDENIAELKARKLTYVVASRQPERDRWLADFEDTDGFAPVLRASSPLNPAQKKTSIEVKSRIDDEQTYVLCRSEQRIAKDRAIRGSTSSVCSPISTSFPVGLRTRDWSSPRRSTRPSDASRSAIRASRVITTSPTMRRPQASLLHSMPTNTPKPNGSTAAICSKPIARTSQVTNSGAYTSCSPEPRLPSGT